MNVTISQPAPVRRSQEDAASASSQRTNKRAIWDLAIGLAGLVYLGVVLIDNLYSPLFGLVLIGLAAYEILEPHCSKRPNIASEADKIAEIGECRRSMWSYIK
jgi:hypothetical protein